MMREESTEAACGLCDRLEAACGLCDKVDVDEGCRWEGGVSRGGR